MAIMPLPSPCKPWHGEQKMLYRSSPRARSFQCTGKGKVFESLGTTSASSAMEPRATVFSTSGRSERPSAKNSEGESGRFFGWSAMSWRRYWQPALKHRAAAAQAMAKMREVLIIGHLADVMRMHFLKDARGVRQMKLRIAGFDAEKEAVRRGVREAMNIENRMMRLRQTVQGEHSKNGGEGRAENRQFESDRNKGRPAIERAASDVERVGDAVDPLLEKESAEATRQAAYQTDRRHHVAFQSERLRKAFHGKRRVSVHEAVTRCPDFLHRMNEFFGSAELPHHAVDVRTVQHYFSSSEVSATSSRISAMEIAGSTRTNRKINMTNRPMVPMNVAQSQNVGL